MAGYIGSKAVNLSTTGADINGNANIDGDLSFGDNNKAIFGAGSDLQIYHNGSDSFIDDAGTGSLYMRSNSVVLGKYTGEVGLVATADGSVDLYYNDVKKLATTSTGIDVTGSISADGLTVDASTTVIQKTGDSPTLQFKGHAGLQNTIGEIQSGRAEFSGTNSFMRFKTNDGTSTKTRLNIDANGDISFYEDTGTTAKLFWDASDQDLTITPNLGNISIKKGVHDATNSVRLEAGGTTSTYLEYRGYLGHIWDVNTTEAMRIDSSGSVIINNSGGDAQLYLGGNSGSNRMYLARSGSDSLLWNVSSGNMKFATNNSERMRIDSSGRVGIGDVPKASFTGHSILQVGGQAILGANDTLSSTGQTYLSHNLYYDTSGTPQVFNTSTANEGTVYAQVDGVHKWSNSAATTGTPSVQERMRLDSSGNLLVGKTSINNNVGGSISAAGQAYFVVNSNTPLLVNRLGTDGVVVQIYNDSNGVGSISVSGSATAYNTSSDYRLKTDAQPMTGATDRLKQLNPVNFEWIADGTRVDGFLAHEAQAVVPEAVTGAKDAMRDEEYEITPAVTDDDGNVVTEAVMGTRSVPDYQGIDQSKLVPLLTAALQEALDEITDLKARVATLEAN